MISNQIIKNTMEELKSITRIEFYVFDTEGMMVAATGELFEIDRLAIAQFADSPADSQVIQGYHFFKVFDDTMPEYVLITKGMGDDVYVMGKVAVCQLQGLITAYKERFDKNNFIQNLLLDNLLLVDVYNRAKKLHIELEKRRIIYIVETKNEKDNNAMEILKGLFGSNARDFITEVDEKSIILVQELEEEDTYEQVAATARTICDMENSEAMSSVTIAYGTICNELQQLPKSYKEARMALNVGKIFYSERKIHAYNQLGIGRLIYQLPMNLCEMFMKEVFTGEMPDTFDEETLMTINKFFENNLNISETARQLFVHRNTLVYRLEKLHQSTGLDIRTFDDALTFKIALMVVNYMNFMNQQEI